MSVHGIRLKVRRRFIARHQPGVRIPEIRSGHERNPPQFAQSWIGTDPSTVTSQSEQRKRKGSPRVATGDSDTATDPCIPHRDVCGCDFGSSHFLACATAWAFAPLTASRNRPAAAGALTRPSSTARVVTLVPYMARLERSSARTNAPLNVAPTKAPLARE